MGAQGIITDGATEASQAGASVSYEGNMNCEWTISDAQENHFVRVSLEHFDLEAGELSPQGSLMGGAHHAMPMGDVEAAPAAAPVCTKDKLTIGNNDHTVELCGTHPSVDTVCVRSGGQSNPPRVSFTTDATTHGRGFRAQYIVAPNAADARCSPLTTDQGCRCLHPKYNELTGCTSGGTHAAYGAWCDIDLDNSDLSTCNVRHRQVASSDGTSTTITEMAWAYCDGQASDAAEAAVTAQTSLDLSTLLDSSTMGQQSAARYGALADAGLIGGVNNAPFAQATQTAGNSDFGTRGFDNSDLSAEFGGDITMFADMFGATSDDATMDFDDYYYDDNYYYYYYDAYYY
jgi:hypothetical protein